MKKKELYGFIIRALGIYFLINQLPGFLFGFFSFFSDMVGFSSYSNISRIIFAVFVAFIPIILILWLVIKAEKVVSLFIKEDSEIVVKEINLETAQLILFNFLGIFIIISSISILIYQFSQLISDRFILFDMEVTRKQTLRMAPHLIKLLLGFFLISRAKAIIKFITKIQEPE